MTRFRGGQCRKIRSSGPVLMIVGLLLLMCFLPKWVWVSVLGLVLISVGFLMWRFS